MTEQNQNKDAEPIISEEEKLAIKKAKKAEYDKVYRAKNKEKLKEHNNLRKLLKSKELKAYRKEYYKKNKEIIRKKSKEKRKKLKEENPNCFSERYHSYKQKNPEKLKATTKAYNDKTKEKRKLNYQKKREQIKSQKTNNEEKAFKKQPYRVRNKEKCLERERNYYHNNKSECNKRNVAYRKERAKRDPLFAAKEKLRIVIHHSFKRIKKNKPANTLELLGCTWEEAKAHIESLWQEGMTWENHGVGLDRWQIDHIRPVASFNEDDLHLMNKIENLQPLWMKDNLKKRDQYKSCFLNENN